MCMAEKITLLKTLDAAAARLSELATEIPLARQDADTANEVVWKLSDDLNKARWDAIKENEKVAALVAEQKALSKLLTGMTETLEAKQAEYAELAGRMDCREMDERGRLVDEVC